MNLKYYLRGLGIGIVVTAVIMGAAGGGQKEQLSDAEIKARAAELGMVESSGLLSELEETPEAIQTPEILEATNAPEATNIPATPEFAKATEEGKTPEPAKATETGKTPEPAKATEESKTPEPAKATETGKTPEPTKASEESKTPEPAKTSEESKTPEATKAPESASIIIEIKSGDGSDTVSRKLEESGLIASASAFDSYLCENGIDKKLQIGVYEIPADASPEEIAKLLAK